jgi:hypothetical protein
VNARDYVATTHDYPCVVHYFKTNEKRRCDEAPHVVPGDDWSVVPLCFDCHQGAKGMHGMHRRPFYNLWKIDEQWLLTRTAELRAKL